MAMGYQFVLYTVLAVVWMFIGFAEVVQTVDSDAKSEIQLHNTIRIPGKVSKLFPVKKSRIWKISKDSIRTENGLEDLDNFNETAPLFVRGHEDEPFIGVNNGFDGSDDDIFGDEVDKKLLNRISEEVQETSGSGSSAERLSSWADLSKALGEHKIKAFLNTIPLHILREITNLTRKSPELGEKKLVQLFLERKQADSLEIGGGFNSESSEDQTHKRLKPTGKEENQIDFKIYSDAKYRDNNLPESTPSTEPTETGNLAIPKYQKTLPEPNPTLQDNHEIMTYFRESNEFPRSTEIIHGVEPQSESATQRSENINSSVTDSGYFLPDITTPGPTSIHQNPETFNDNPNIRISNSAQQNPIHTYKSNVDDFLEPPLDNRYPHHHSGESGESSSVWTGQPGVIGGNNGQIHYSDIKLLSAPSNTNDMYVHQTDGYTFQGPGQDYGIGSEYHDHNPFPNFEQNQYNHELYSSQNSNFHYHHPTIDHNSPPPIQIPSYPGNTAIDPIQHNNHAYQPFSTIIPQQYQPSHNKPSSPQVISGKDYVNNDNRPDKNYVNTDNRPDKNYPQTPAPPKESDAPKKPENGPITTSQTEQNPSTYQSGWGSGGGPNSDWGPSEIWNALKTYIKKDSKSTAEKVFEVSIGLLSFFAFGGYLLMLIIQVFAVTTAFPFFPMFTATVPQNPTLFGALFGRGMKSQSDGSYRFNPNVVMNEKYIEELESIVKKAMGKVKSDWTGIVKNL